MFAAALLEIVCQCIFILDVVLGHLWLNRFIRKESLGFDEAVVVGLIQ